MMEYLGVAATTTLGGAPVNRFWCVCCKVESQYVESGYLSYPTTSTTPTTSTKYWKSATSTTTTFSYSFDED